MAGRGPAPKDPAKRARRNADVVALRVVEATPVPQPDLPEFDVERTVDGEAVMVPFVWPAATRGWWSMLEHHPLAPEFTDLDWSYLLDTARLHADFWLGATKHAGELRLREAKYGFTPEDRLRLRLQFAQTTTAEAEVERKTAGARSRFGGIQVSNELS